MKSSLKSKLPPSVWTFLTRSYDTLLRLPEIPKAYLHPLRRASRSNLSKLRNSNQGLRCFIIGNGPSLRDLDLTKLKNEKTFGLNRIYLAFPELGFNTSYLVCVNDLVIQQCADEIHALQIPKFIAWRAYSFIEPSSDLNFLYTTYTGPKFSKDLRNRVWEGATVTFVALQLAFYMGFQQAILIGVDHNFTTSGKPNQTVTSEGDDPNHFSTKYFGKGFRWQLPDLHTSEMAYRLAKAAYEKDGRQVLDATRNGKLTIFPKVDYDTLFE
jgi:hypothetical protein